MGKNPEVIWITLSYKCSIDSEKIFYELVFACLESA